VSGPDIAPSRPSERGLYCLSDGLNTCPECPSMGRMRRSSDGATTRSFGSLNGPLVSLLRPPTRGPLRRRLPVRCPRMSTLLGGPTKKSEREIEKVPLRRRRSLADEAQSQRTNAGFVRTHTSPTWSSNPQTVQPEITVARRCNTPHSPLGHASHPGLTLLKLWTARSSTTWRRECRLGPSG
jgi:hypothetical protein